MNKFILVLLALVIATSVLGTPYRYSNEDTNHIFELNIKGETYYLIPQIDGDRPMGYQPDPNNPNACMGTIMCYQCCTGDKEISKKLCVQIYHNWNKGNECNC